ncbi:ATP synthase F0 subunit B [Geomonas sp. Red69]|uniref:ATP synthase subunit b n=1 Tax=Geomonas diazotrophica TaxID=2843197 RepID=A0ABX8JKV1_9BACT|nr:MULTISPECIES: ATP synthase F0 subunit B [Geomonas]MBU5638478.1 ATP synthase F0 subunit B [Geomonas diazotrophica]QWV97254.1 ATP synthase F0 subunit B [Geomonas nitrogeniifigens]QXE86425.1 ATP synthase F0 subunit B [Geomonas nitrogeniifigens]
MHKNKKLIVSLLTVGAIIALASLGFAEEAAEHAGAAHEGGHQAAQMKDFMWRCIDFAALVAIAVWALKKADVKGTLAARRDGIEKTLKEAVAAKEAAEKKFAEYSQRLDQANQEIEVISANMKREGELEKERIIAEAKEAAARIKVQAEAAAAQEVLKAKDELRAEAARLAVELAEQKIKQNIAKGDQDKLVGDYISKVVTLH